MLPEPIDARAGLAAVTGCTNGDVPVKEHRQLVYSTAFRRNRFEWGCAYKFLPAKAGTTNPKINKLLAREDQIRVVL